MELHVCTVFFFFFVGCYTLQNSFFPSTSMPSNMPRVVPGVLRVLLLLLLALAPASLALRTAPSKTAANVSNATCAFQYYALYETVEAYPVETVTVRYNTASETIGIGFDEDFGPVVATAEQRAMQYQNGWDQVLVRLEPTFYTDKVEGAPAWLDIAYRAAGVAEGYLTFDKMQAHLTNTWDGPQGLRHLAALPAVQDWVAAQMGFLAELAADPASGAYGRQLRRLLSLLDGIASGYNVHQDVECALPAGDRSQISAVHVAVADGLRASSSGGGGGSDADTWSLNRTTLFLLNAQAEVGDIVKAVHLQGKVAPRHGGRTAAEALRSLARRFPHYLADLHCSALVKVVPDEDLFVAHVTWNSFESMTRQHKTYVLERTDLEQGEQPGEAARKSITMSGYPGLISSIDDWYQTHRRLVVTETTIGVYNQSLFEEHLRPRTVPTFLRVLLANYLSSDLPSDWFDLFGRHNSGTYNNQWMVVRMAARPNAALPPNTFWVGEQLPAAAPPAAPGSVYSNVSYGLTAADLSTHLSATGYWASYNLPFFRDVDERSGTAAHRAEVGTLCSYNETPRARIFAREQLRVRTLGDVMQLMRSNDYREDPLSLIPNCSGTATGVCDPPRSAFLAVAARGDLNPPGGAERYGPSYPSLGHRNHGATDAKITSWRSMTAADDAAAGAGTVYVSYMVNGPTTAGGRLPRFRWRKGLFTSMPPVWGLPTYQRDVYVRLTAPGPDDRGSGAARPAAGYVVAAVCALVLVAAVVYVAAKARQAQQYAVPRGQPAAEAAPLLA
ncbi:lysosomal/endosomal membrane protein p67 [Strigomonas culicis]|uniref:Phospholipase B-like n=1 Tax=Strigomonas culicis TaxID=28005 RepID=S9U358_9TRYP|nr:lysosomal/endosomal membrane protein p67 [Strigomonas culicis]|eukprot:EPY25227.1 lysosomal/endosomal membrane protein p67 [Strigomonas culicis]